MYIFQPEREMLTEQIRKYAGHISGEVLDIGAGSYDRYSKFFTKAERYLRMDINHGAQVDVVGSITEIPLKDSCLDSIVCTQVLEHVREPEKAMEEMFRVLKKDGKLLLTVPQTNELHEVPYDFFRYTNYGIRSLASTAGFSVLVEEQRGGVYALFAQVVIRYVSDVTRADVPGVWSACVRKALFLFGKAMLRIDRRCRSVSSMKHTIGWLFILQK